MVVANSSAVILKKYLETHNKNFVRNNKGLRRALNLNKKQLADAIRVLMKQNFLTRYSDSKTAIYQVNRNKLPLLCKAPTSDEKAVTALREYLKDKTQIKNITLVANTLCLPYQRTRKAIEVLEIEGLLSEQSVRSNNHRTFFVIHK